MDFSGFTTNNLIVTGLVGAGVLVAGGCLAARSLRSKNGAGPGFVSGQAINYVGRNIDPTSPEEEAQLRELHQMMNSGSESDGKAPPPPPLTGRVTVETAPNRVNSVPNWNNLRKENPAPPPPPVASPYPKLAPRSSQPNLPSQPTYPNPYPALPPRSAHLSSLGSGSSRSALPPVVVRREERPSALVNLNGGMSDADALAAAIALSK